MCEATLRLTRAGIGIGFGGQYVTREAWPITIDGTVFGAIANKDTVEIAVTPGHHTVQLGSGRHRSPRRSFDINEDEVVSFRCHGPMILPVFVASFVKPDLWISLRRV
jgi:hypothetical protein